MNSNQIPEGLKITRTFRMTPEAVALVQQASESNSVSQGEIIEGCILDSIGRVTDRLVRAREARSSQRAAVMSQMQKRPVGRPRKQVSPKDHTN